MGEPWPWRPWTWCPQGVLEVGFHLRRFPQGVASVLRKKTPICASWGSTLDRLTVAPASLIRMKESDKNEGGLYALFCSGEHSGSSHSGPDLSLSSHWTNRRRSSGGVPVRSWLHYSWIASVHNFCLLQVQAAWNALVYLMSLWTLPIPKLCLSRCSLICFHFQDGWPTASRWLWMLFQQILELAKISRYKLELLVVLWINVSHENPLLLVINKIIICYFHGDFFGPIHFMMTLSMIFHKCRLMTISIAIIWFWDLSKFVSFSEIHS